MASTPSGTADPERRYYDGSAWALVVRRPRRLLAYAVAVGRGSLGVRGNYLCWALRWRRHGGDPRWWLAPERWLVLRSGLRSLPRGARVLELGSGLAGLLIADSGYAVTSLDQERAEVEKGARAAGDRLRKRMRFVHAPLRELEPGCIGYSFEVVAGETFDAIVVDGPSGDVGRRGILVGGRPLLAAADLVVLDDTDRQPERQLAVDLAEATGRRAEFADGVAIVR